VRLAEAVDSFATDAHAYATLAQTIITI